MGLDATLAECFAMADAILTRCWMCLVVGGVSLGGLLCRKAQVALDGWLKLSVRKQARVVPYHVRYMITWTYR